MRIIFKKQNKKNRKRQLIGSFQHNKRDRAYPDSDYDINIYCDESEEKPQSRTHNPTMPE